MNKVFLVAHYSFKEALKNKILMNVVFLGGALVLLTYIAASITYAAQQKVTLDFGMGLISIALKVIAIFYGVGVLQQEIESRTIYLILSRPITKTQYFLGRITGMAFILLLNTLLLVCIELVLYYLVDGELSTLMGWALLFMYLEALLLFVIVVVFSLFSSKVLSILVGISIYVAGYTADSLLASNVFAQKRIFKFVLEVCSALLPNFGRLNLRDYLIYNHNVPTVVNVSTLSHVLLYLAAMVLIGAVVMRYKSLD